jgi:hypothetical protein
MYFLKLPSPGKNHVDEAKSSVATSLFAACFLPGLSFDHEDGGSTLLENIMNYIVLHLRT